MRAVDRTRRRASAMKRPMRILYIHQYFSTPRGSAGTRSYEQARAMAAAGHEVVMLTSTAQLGEDEVPRGRGFIRRGRIAGVDCIVLDVRYHQTMGYLRRVLSFLKFMGAATWFALAEPAVGVTYATSTPLTVGVAALAGRLLRGRPFVFEVRDLWPDVPLAMGILKPGFASRLLKWFERIIYRRAALLVAVNEDVGARMLRAAGRPRPLVVAPNACDTRLFRPDLDGLDFRRRHGLEGKILFVHAGTMGRVNGLDAVLDAAAYLRTDDRMRFVLIGEGKERSRLEQRVAAEGLTSVVILDPLPKAALAGVLAGSDVGLMTVAAIPILELNCANKFFDYLSSGLPVVLNYEGWQARVLEEHHCGLSAPQGDLEVFVEAIRRLADDAGLRQTMGRNARALAETRFDRETIVAEILRGLERI